MPKALASREINTFFEQPLKKEKKRGWGVKITTCLGGIAVAAGMAAGSLHGAGEAKADNNYIIGGRDADHVGGTSEAYMAHLLETHQISPDDNNFPIDYAAGMVPGLDSSSMTDSVHQGVAVVRNVRDTKADPREKSNYFGYSLGGPVAILAAKDDPGKPNHLTLEKTGFGPGSISTSKLAHDAGMRSIAEQNGIMTDVPLPTDIPTTINANSGDIFSGGWSVEDLQQAFEWLQTTFSSGAHDMSNPEDFHKVLKIANITLNWYGNDAPTLTLDMPQLPPVQELLAQWQAQIQSVLSGVPMDAAPESQPPVAEVDTPEAPAPVDEAPEAAPVVLASDVAPAPEAVPVVEAPAPDMVPLDETVPVPEPDPVQPDFELAG